MLHEFLNTEVANEQHFLAMMVRQEVHAFENEY